jgi:hypothetical protein
MSQGLPGPQQTGSPSTSAGLSYRVSPALGLGLGVPLVAAIGALLWLTTHRSEPVMMASMPGVLVIALDSVEVSWTSHALVQL